LVVVGKHYNNFVKIKTASIFFKNIKNK